YRRGLRVTTTFDARMQAAAPRAAGDRGDKDVETGLVAVEPGTGAVLAEYGGRDYLRHQYDNAFLARLPSGASFYPFVRATAAGRGSGRRSWVDASPVPAVLNDDDATAGSTSLLDATVRSYNTAFARLGGKLGASAAARAGLPGRFPGPSVRAVDAAAAYA